MRARHDQMVADLEAKPPAAAEQGQAREE